MHSSCDSSDQPNNNDDDDQPTFRGEVLVNLSANDLNISASGPNAFIHTGSGDDHITVVGGNNLIDAGGGSNFIIGGSGHDTFVLDDRNADADIWNSIVNFHSGDTAFVLGLSATDFTIDRFDNQGVPGFLGLTFDAAGPHDQALTLAGFTQNDIASGKLVITSGDDFLKIQAT